VIDVFEDASLLASTSRLIRIYDGSLDAVRGGGGGKMDRRVREVNLVHVHFIPFNPRPVLQ